VLIDAAAGTKRCSRCGLNKPLAEFNVSNEFGHQFYCRDCQGAWYRDNRTRHIANVTVNTERYRGRNIAFVLEYLKSHPCVDCGETDPMVLEFDHVRGKRHTISKLKWASASLEDIEQEIARCDVRCVNCHIRRTAVQFGWRKSRENAP
jgi:hypothetical protein